MYQETFLIIHNLQVLLILIHNPQTLVFIIHHRQTLLMMLHNQHSLFVSLLAIVMVHHTGLSSAEQDGAMIAVRLCHPLIGHPLFLPLHLLMTRCRLSLVLVAHRFLRIHKSHIVIRLIPLMSIL